MRIAVIASYATDTITMDGNVVVRNGGPAFFIVNALRKLDVPCDTYAGTTPARVRITVRDGTEHGAAEFVSPIDLPATITADACIVSTILDELPFARVAQLPGYVALDVQGYVRQYAREGHVWVPDGAAWQRCACVKATEEELAAIDGASVALQQQERTLIVTRGAQGAVLWHHGVARAITTDAVAVAHALGAGDGFLAAFTVAVLRGATPSDACAFAAVTVRAWLMERLDSARNAVWGGDSPFSAEGVP